jgi:hypothetical protein
MAKISDDAGCVYVWFLVWELTGGSWAGVLVFATITIILVF